MFYLVSVATANAFFTEIEANDPYDAVEVYLNTSEYGDLDSELDLRDNDTLTFVVYDSADETVAIVEANQTSPWKVVRPTVLHEDESFGLYGQVSA